MTGSATGLTTGLWNGMRIPIVLLSGEVNSGKTLWGLLVDPNCRKSAGETKPTTIWWDNEGSAETYAGGLNFEWKDVRSAVADGFHLRTAMPHETDPKWRRILLTTADVNDSPSASLFRAWYLHLLISIQPGQYLVGGVDTFTPIQEGLIDWLRRHPEAFGRSERQYDKAAPMFLWPDVKCVLSYILATDCRLRFQTFVMTVHLRNEWTGSGDSAKKTGHRIAEGLDVLEKLCTLHLRLDRSPKAKGKEAPRVPSAIVVKERLVRFGASASQDEPILTPRLPDATPDGIRAYIANPPDFANLKPEERLPDQSLTEDQRLQIVSATAADERAAAEANLSRVELMRQAAQVQQIVAPAKQHAQPAAEQTAAPAMAATSQIAELERRLLSTFDSPDEAKQWFFAGSQGLRPNELTESAMDDCLIALTKLEAERSQQRATEKLVAAAASSDGLATQEQRDQIRKLSGMAGISDEQNLAWLRERGVSSYRSITQADAVGRIAELESMVSADATPF